ncbi:VanZ like family protein [compost metagenome]
MRLAQSPPWLRLVLFIGVSAILLDAGLRPEPIPQVFNQEDKLHHLVGFMALAFCCRLAFPATRLSVVTLGCLLTGVLIEAAQELMPLRTASAYDMLANCTGVLIGLLLARALDSFATKTSLEPR